MERPLDRDGTTPFYIACRHGDLPLVKWLAEEAGAGRDGRAGVNMERAASDGSTPASIAAHEGHTVRSLDRVE